MNRWRSRTVVVMATSWMSICLSRLIPDNLPRSLWLIGLALGALAVIVAGAVLADGPARVLAGTRWAVLVAVMAAGGFAAAVIVASEVGASPPMYGVVTGVLAALATVALDLGFTRVPAVYRVYGLSSFVVGAGLLLFAGQLVMASLPLDGVAVGVLGAAMVLWCGALLRQRRDWDEYVAGTTVVGLGVVLLGVLESRLVLCALLLFLAAVECRAVAYFRQRDWLRRLAWLFAAVGAGCAGGAFMPNGFATAMVFGCAGVWALLLVGTKRDDGGRLGPDGALLVGCSLVAVAMVNWQGLTAMGIGTVALGGALALGGMSVMWDASALMSLGAVVMSIAGALIGVATFLMGTGTGGAEPRFMMYLSGTASLLVSGALLYAAISPPALLRWGRQSWTKVNRYMWVRLPESRS